MHERYIASFATVNSKNADVGTSSVHQFHYMEKNKTESVFVFAKMVDWIRIRIILLAFVYMRLIGFILGAPEHHSARTRRYSMMIVKGFSNTISILTEFGGRQCKK